MPCPILPQHQAQAASTAAAAQAPAGPADEETNGHHASQNYATAVPTSRGHPQHSHFSHTTQHSPDTSAATFEPAPDTKFSRGYVPFFFQYAPKWPGASPSVAGQAWASGISAPSTAVPSPPATPGPSAATATTTAPCCGQDGPSYRNDGAGSAELPGKHERPPDDPSAAAAAAHARTSATIHADGARPKGGASNAAWHDPRTMARCCRADTGSSESTGPCSWSNTTATHDHAASHDDPGATASAAHKDVNSAAAWCQAADSPKTWYYCTQCPAGPSPHPQVSQLTSAATASP